MSIYPLGSHEDWELGTVNWRNLVFSAYDGRGSAECPKAFEGRYISGLDQIYPRTRGSWTINCRCPG